MRHVRARRMRSHRSSDMIPGAAASLADPRPPAAAVSPGYSSSAWSIQLHAPASTGWTDLCLRAQDWEMDYRRPRFGRDPRMGIPADALQLYARHYQLIACCLRPGCNHRRELPVEFLIRAFGRDAPLEAVGARLRCHLCGTRGARIEVRYTGPTGRAH